MATIHRERLQQLDLADRPALGAFAAQVAVAREMARWQMQMSIRDYVIRNRTCSDLAQLHEATRLGRRFDLLANDLRRLADYIEDVPGRRTGGFSLRSAA